MNRLWTSWLHTTSLLGDPCRIFVDLRNVITLITFKLTDILTSATLFEPFEVALRVLLGTWAGCNCGREIRELHDLVGLLQLKVAIDLIIPFVVLGRLITIPSFVHETRIGVLIPQACMLDE